MRFDGIETAAPPTLGSRPGTAQRPAVRPSGQGGEEAAHKLRARGFSYRRIAEELRVRYDMVSVWLSGLPSTSRAAAPPAPFAARRAAAEPQQEQLRMRAADPADAARITELERRLSEAFVAIQRLSDEARQREARLQSTLVEERRAAALQIEQLNTDVAGLRAALSALSLRPPGTPPGTEGARPASTGFWQRREH